MICFVSAPAGVDTQPVIDTLALEGIEHIDSGSPRSRAPLMDAIRDEIASSDLVLIILPGREPDPPVFMIEAGIALGLGKRLLVLVPKSRQPPAIFSEVQCLRADPDDVDAIRLNVRAALQDVGIPRGHHSEVSGPQPQRELASWLTSVLAELPKTPGQAADASLEQTVADLFRRAGGQVESSPWPQNGPDLAVLFESPSPVAGALVVEAKHIRNKTDLRKAMLQVQQYVLQRGAALGVVAYLSASRPIDRPAPVPRIVPLDISDLPRRLQSQSLGEILRAERNRAVHEM